MKVKGIVIDLDGTFLLGNSFERYFFFLAKSALSRLRFVGFLRLLLLLMGRKLRLYSHSTFKRKVLQERGLDETQLHAFVTLLSKGVNPAVFDLFEKYRKMGYYTCLATAAPLVYARLIGEKYGFDAVCATASVNGNYADGSWVENIRENKLAYVESFLAKREVSIDVVITDHHDDLPLIKRAKESSIMVAPSVETVRCLIQQDVQYNVI